MHISQIKKDYLLFLPLYKYKALKYYVVSITVGLHSIFCNWTCCTIFPGVTAFTIATLMFTEDLQLLLYNSLSSEMKPQESSMSLLVACANGLHQAVKWLLQYTSAEINHVFKGKNLFWVSLFAMFCVFCVYYISVNGYCKPLKNPCSSLAPFNLLFLPPPKIFTRCDHEALTYK